MRDSPCAGDETGQCAELRQHRGKRGTYAEEHVGDALESSLLGAEGILGVGGRDGRVTAGVL